MQKKILQDVQDSLKKVTGMPIRELGEKMRDGLKTAVLKSVSPACDDTSMREKAESLLAAARAAQAARPDTRRQAEMAFSNSMRTVHSLCLAGVGRVGGFVTIPSVPREKISRIFMAVGGGNSSPQNMPPQRREGGNYSTGPSYSVPGLEGETKIYTASRASHRTRHKSSPLAWLSVGVTAIIVVAAGCYLLFQTPAETPEEDISVAVSVDQMGTAAENIETMEEMPLAMPIDDGKPAPRSKAQVQDNLAPVPKQVELTRDGVNLRDGHSTKGTRILARLDRQRMNVLHRWDGPTETWYLLETDHGVGWVISLYLREAAPASARKSAPAPTTAQEPAPAPAVTTAQEPAPAPSPAPAPAPATKPAASVKTTHGFVKGTSVNVRDGHSTRGTNILTKYSNRDVEIIGSWRGKGDPFPWYKIQTENGEAWIYGQYIELR